MRSADYDYDLPPDRIAQNPVAERARARMMVMHRASGLRTHAHVFDLPRFLRTGDLLVLNDTRVIPARVSGTWKDTGGAVELLLVEATGPHHWRCLCRSGRRVRPGLALSVAGGELHGVICGSADAEVVVAFDPAADLFAVLEKHGRTPLPPYIRRQDPAADETADRERYQTVYARRPGAVAAPTAGLHFTPELLTQLKACGIATACVTLHVGPGTFRPVTADAVEAHRMDAERYAVPAATAEALCACRRRGGRIVAVGSTTVRTLETMALEHGGPAPCEGRSDLFIRPPFTFGLTDILLTNFHLPRSTLLMMVAAWAGRENILDAYREAVQREYRFYSYGDCMLLLP